MTIHLGRKTACRLPHAYLRIQRRIGLPPRLRGSTSGANCPDVFELSDHRIAVIGKERTAEIREAHPTMRPLAHTEIVVVVDPYTLAYAIAHLEVG
ncbi:hypothetical protein ACWCQZ_10765 [Streptomyces sp. NPDC002285]